VLVGNETKKPTAGFGTLESPVAAAVKAKAEAWLKGVAAGDAAKLQQFERVWKEETRSVTDRLADTFALGNAAAAKLLAEARNQTSPAPIEVPAILKDAKQPEFFRANLALAYSRALSNRRIHEEALETLKLFRPEQVVDPSAFLFHRAVCEHALLQRQEAGKTIGRLLQDALDSPERYKTVGMLMLLDMQTWKDKDLGAVARKMDNIQRRLDLARGGPQTQRLQKEVILRLDELIKELENKAKKDCECNGGGCPNGGQPQPGGSPSGSNNPTSPMPDSTLPGGGGTGRVDQAKLRQLAEGWGRMSERQRAEAMQQVSELTRGLSLAHQEAIREYFRRLAEGGSR
jgi:hypothetical protein